MVMRESILKKDQKITCIICGTLTPKYKKGNTSKPKRFCSHKCYWEWRSTLRREQTNIWKGDEVGYEGIHAWLRREFGLANKCEGEDCWGKSKAYHWANISGKYLRRRSDFKMLCASCHLRYDYAKFGARKNKAEASNDKT